MTNAALLVLFVIYPARILYRQHYNNLNNKTKDNGHTGNSTAAT